METGKLHRNRWCVLASTLPKKRTVWIVQERQGKEQWRKKTISDSWSKLASLCTGKQSTHLKLKFFYGTLNLQKLCRYTWDTCLLLERHLSLLGFFFNFDKFKFIAQLQICRELSSLFPLMVDPTTLDQRAALLFQSGTWRSERQKELPKDMQPIRSAHPPSFWAAS